jgi:hypothetical protein
MFTMLVRTPTKFGAEIWPQVCPTQNNQIGITLNSEYYAMHNLVYLCRTYGHNMTKICRCSSYRSKWVEISIFILLSDIQGLEGTWYLLFVLFVFLGILEAGFIKPTHDKQDFEKSVLYQRLENRLKEMTYEYW